MRATPKRSIALVSAVCVGSGLAHFPTSTMPFQIGALVDGAGLSAAAAGVFGFCQVGALAAAMILIAPWLDRTAPMRVALIGGLTATLANLALYASHTPALLMLAGVLAGSGYGVVFAATVAAAAATREPDRVYAIGNGGALLMIVALLSALPALTPLLGALGIFPALSGLALLCLPFFAGFGGGRCTQDIRLAAWRTPGAPGLLFAWTAFSLGTGALYAFSERIGRGLHLQATQIALVLSSGVLIGVLGTGAAVLLGGRLRRAALIVGMCGSGTACLLLGVSWSWGSFATGVALYWIFYMFLYSYLFGTAAVLDPSGRVGTLGGGLERLAYAVGSGLGGALAEHAGYPATGYLGFAGCLLGLFVGFPSLFRHLTAAVSRDCGEPPSLEPRVGPRTG
ncbi:MAG TPA: hypothetical protein VHB68_04065 [Steroidobacteraceae bacterium]|nr:hypothetical protein [Steroidobacteraceae bacterium]